MNYNVVMKYLHISNAIESNSSLSLINWIYTNKEEYCDVSCIQTAVLNNRVDILEWLYTHKYVYCVNCVNNSSFVHLHPFNQLYTTCEHMRFIIDIAATNGYLNVLKWFHEKKIGNIHHSTLNEALEYGHLHVAKYLLYNCLDKNWCGKSLEVCAEKGMYEIAQWIHTKCNYNDENIAAAIIKAATNGHLNIVKWLCENRVTLYTKAEDGADINGHTQIVDYLRTISNGKNDNTTLLRSNVSNE